MTTAKTVNTSKETFEAHQNLLMDVIKQQAGSLSKAVLEAVMNSVDAGATHVHVLLDDEQLIIRDDGKGFASADEIRNNFKVFGLPQGEVEKLAKTYGRFRMGRGQLFAFGVNTWTTNRYKMADIDIQKNGLEWSLIESDRTLYNGCQIEVTLYEPLDDYRIRMVHDELAEGLRYTPVTIMFNGEQLNEDPLDEAWPHSDEGFLARFDRTSSIAVYNRGVLVRRYYSRGCGGVVISQERLDVNFARNDVLESCPVWKRIQAAIRKFASEQLDKQTTLTDTERQEVVRQFLSGHITPDTFYRKAVFRTATGRYVTWNTLRQAATKYPCLCFAPRGDRQASYVMRNRLAYVLDENTKELTRSQNAETAIQLINRAMPDYWQLGGGKGWPIIQLDRLVDHVSQDYQLLPADALGPEDKLYLAVIREGHMDLMCQFARHKERVTQRTVHLADSAKEVLSWTDGASHIVFNRRLLRELNLFDVDDLTTLALSLIACYAAHDDSYTAAPTDQDYYERYFSLSSYAGAFVNGCLTKSPKAVKKMGKELTKAQLIALAKFQQAHFAQQRLLGLGDDADDVDTNDAA